MNRKNIKGMVSDIGNPIGEAIIGYKKARGEHLIVLEIPSTVKHNMNRKNIKDKVFAKYRCSEAVVKEIINLTTGESVNEARSIQDRDFEYNLGQKVVPHIFEEDNEIVCGGGIHYFLNRQCAELYEMTVYEGEFKSWYDNGQMDTHCFYRDGQREGEFKTWHSNGQMDTQGFYRDGKREGEFKTWHPNGQMDTQGFYRDGKLV
jgi:hypothetical protein